MPRICEFFGITIYMYYREHQPPHFHAMYGGDEALINIDTFSVYAGHLPPRAMGLVVEWAALHKDELLADWNLAREHQALQQIEPLK